MAEEEQQPMVQALKQRRKRKKATAKDAALGVKNFTVEAAGVFKPDLKKVMKDHGLNIRQEVYQNLLRNLIAADFVTQAKMLRCVTTPFTLSQKLSIAFIEQSMLMIQLDGGDELISPPSS